MLKKISGNLLLAILNRSQWTGGVGGRRFPLSRALTTYSAAPLRTSNVYEPDYLESLRPKYPQYDSLNIQIKGYDYPVLESYQRFVHQVADYLDIDVSDCYAMPPQHVTAKRLRPKSSVVEAEYRMTIYERNLQLEDVDAHLYPVFLRLIQAALPEGVDLQVQENTEELQERRYVPDRDLLELKAELGRMQTGGGGGGGGGGAQKKK